MSLSNILHWIKKQRIHSIRKSYPVTITRDREQLVKRMFIDVSVISKHDAGTGIQRVVRSVTAELFNLQPENLELHTVSATQKSPYHVAAWLNLPTTLEGTRISAQSGDIFLGLDFALDTIHQHRKQLIDFRKSGGELWFVMYDLLPLTHPQWFSEKLVTRYKQWLDDLAMLANGFYCISKSVESELCNTLKRRYGINEGIDTQTIPMGWNLTKNHPSKGFPLGFDKLLGQMKQSPSTLMVGTLEPRKGHSDIVDAFDALWAQGENHNLIIAGRPGWKTENLQTRIRNHPKHNLHLFWLDNISDEAIEELYKHCTGVIVASLAEGFGLPLIEAIGHNKPILARNINVFRERGIETSTITYFPEKVTADEMCPIIINWLGKPLIEKTIKATSWKDSADHIINQQLSPKGVAYGG